MSEFYPYTHLDRLDTLPETKYGYPVRRVCTPVLRLQQIHKIT